MLLFTWHCEAAVLNLNAVFTPESSHIGTCVWITGPGALQLQDNGPDHLYLLCVAFTCVWQRVGPVRPHDQSCGSSHIDSCAQCLKIDRLPVRTTFFETVGRGLSESCGGAEGSGDSDSETHVKWVYTDSVKYKNILIALIGYILQK